MSVDAEIREMKIIYFIQHENLVNFAFLSRRIKVE